MQQLFTGFFTYLHVLWMKVYTHPENNWKHRCLAGDRDAVHLEGDAQCSGQPCAKARHGPAIDWAADPRSITASKQNPGQYYLNGANGTAAAADKR